MAKVKTSVYIDRELWRRFREYVRRKGGEVSEYLESVIEDAMFEDALVRELSDLIEEGSADEIDFEPVAPEGGSVSELVRVMRDERAGHLSRQ